MSRVWGSETPMFADSSVAIAESTKNFMQAAHRLPSLNELSDEAVQLACQLEAVEDPEEVAAIEANLALIDQMLIEKTESYCHVIKEFDAMAAERKRDADRMRARAQAAERHADFLKNRLLANLQVVGRKRVELARYTLSVVQNPPSVQVLDASAVPAEFKRTVITTTVDKRAVLDAFKSNGEMIPGTEISRTERLSIT
ncbi:MAG: hypothetical protein NVS4B6_22680 [Mycobacterium sp.]